MAGPGRSCLTSEAPVTVAAMHDHVNDACTSVCNLTNLRMDTGNFADYAFGSGSEDITFIYTVQEGDNSDPLDAWDAPADGELSVCS